MLEKTTIITLATVFTFYLKIHNAHFNITGPNFYQYHKFLNDFYEDVFDSFDKFGEEARALDIQVPAGLQSFLQFSFVKDFSEFLSAEGYLTELLADNTKVLYALTELNKLAESKPGFQNFIQERIDKHSWWEWQLKSLVS